MSVDLKSKVDTNLKLLCEILDIDELFLTALQGDDAIDPETKAEFLAIENPFKRNACFLDWLKQCSPESFRLCMQQLRNDHQQHIANLLEGTQGELPLSEDLKKQLRKNILSLSKLIDTHSGIIDYLWSKDAISSKYQQYINSVQSDIEKNVKLINIIAKKSDRTYNFLLDALIATGQGHVIEYLTEGTIAPIHVQFQGPPSDLTQFEHYVTEYFNAIAREIQPSEVEERTKQLRSIFDEKIKIIGCKQAHSIVMFLWCKDDKAVLELLSMFETRQLEKELEKLFSNIKTPIKMPNLIVRVVLTTEDLLSLRQTASLLSSEAILSLKHEELQQRYCHLKSYAVEIEQKMAADEATIDELRVKSAKLERKLGQLESLREKNLAQQKGASLSLETVVTEENVELFGVAYLNETIYLLSTAWIYAHQDNSLYLRNMFEDIEIPDIRGPCDIAACQKTQHLYVTDQLERCVWQIQMSKSDRKPWKWVLDIVEPFTLFVSGDAHVLILKSSPEPSVVCYNPRGDVVKTLSLQIDQFTYPIHAVKTVAGKFVVSLYNEQDVLSDNCEIYEFDEKRKNKKKKRLQMPDVSYMVAGDENWVFVASRDYSTITMSDGQMACEILNYQKDGIQFPSKLCFIEGNEWQLSRLVILQETAERQYEASVCSLPRRMFCLLEDWE